MDHRFARLGQVLVIFAQPAAPVEPAERALDDPPLRQDHEPLLSVRPPHDLQLDPTPLPQLPHPLDKFTRVSAVGPDQAQPRPLVRQHLEQQSCAVAVLGGSRRHADDQQQAERVHEDVPFAPVDVLPGVMAFFAAPLRGLDALRIEDGCRRRRLPPGGFAQPLAQAVMDALPHPLQPPVPEVVIGDPPRRELVRQQAPGAARAHDVEDCVNNLASGILRRAASGFGFRDQRSEPMPLGVA